MCASGQLVIILTGLFLIECSATAQELYSTFLALCDPKDPRPIAIRSPALLDTNNVGTKLTFLNLAQSKVDATIGDVHLGMTMEEVVKRWGKPKFFWSRCYGGPLLSYQDVSVVLSPASNSVKTIMLHVDKLPKVHGGLPASSSPEQFEAVLGKATSREHRPQFDSLDLKYCSDKCSLTLLFSRDWLNSIRLDAVADSSAK